MSRLDDYRIDRIKSKTGRTGEGSIFHNHRNRKVYQPIKIRIRGNGNGVLTISTDPLGVFILCKLLDKLDFPYLVKNMSSVLPEVKCSCFFI